MGDPGQGIVHVIGPEQGLTHAGHDHRLRRQPHRHPRRLRGPGLRHRHQRGRARARHPDPAPARARAPWPSTSRASCPPASPPRTSILAIIGRIGTGGGIGSIIEYRGSAIRGLSMEGRMTVCNMSIEAGAKAGLIAPDETTFAYLEGRAHAPKGEDWEAALERLALAAHRRGRHLRQGGHHRRRHAAPVRLLGHQPRPGDRARPATCPTPTRFADPAERDAAAPGAGVHGPHRRHADQGRARRHRVHRLLHQQPHRGPAGRRRRGRGPHGQARRARHGRARLVRGEGPGRGRGPRQGLHRRRLRLARARLLDVPGHEPRQARPGRALGLHLNRNFEGRQGRGGRTHLVSPAVAAATAIAGTFADPRDLD